MTKRLVLLIVGLALAAVASAWLATRTRSAKPPEGARISAVATFYPLAEAVRQVGGDRVAVATLVPPGGEPHEYEPTPADIEAAVNGRLFVMNGGVDAWAERLLPDLRRAGVSVVRVEDAMLEIAADPHVWLDPVREKAVVLAVRDALTRADPDGASIYASNAARYAQALDELDRAYASGLKNCSVRAVVTSHDALGYLAARYGFRAVPIAGLNPDQEPSPRTMAQIADAARAAGVKYVFFETLLSPKIARTVAETVGARLLPFNPIEGLTPEQAAKGMSYVSVMRDNLQALETAMSCS